MKKNILSIQSKLVYGYVGSNIAELAIQLHGLDVISFPTVYLSTHTGHQPVFGTVISKTLFDDLIKGINNLDVLSSTGTIISGYIGSEEIIESSANYIQYLKEKYPHTTYICDPVMGDIGLGLYVPEAVANKLISSLLPLCDVLTPNHFELEHIVGHTINSQEDILAHVCTHPILSTKTIIATSCNLKDNTAPQDLETIIIKGTSIKRVKSRKIDIQTIGTGDLFTAILASRLTLGKDIDTAVEDASTIVSDVLNYIVKEGYPEMNASSLLKYIK